jgi:hypothetical protein
MPEANCLWDNIAQVSQHICSFETFGAPLGLLLSLLLIAFA